ncbi:unnamed protein product, partial [Meganyctiphanes norvegica]
MLLLLLQPMAPQVVAPLTESAHRSGCRYRVIPGQCRAGDPWLLLPLLMQHEQYWGCDAGYSCYPEGKTKMRRQGEHSVMELSPAVMIQEVLSNRLREVQFLYAV